MAHQNAIPEPVSFLEDTYNHILLDNRQEPLGVHQDDTKPPARQIDAEGHSASSFDDDGNTVAEGPPRPAAQESNSEIKSITAGGVVATRESIPPVVWEGLEIFGGRGFLSSFVIDVIEDLEADIINNDITKLFP